MNSVLEYLKDEKFVLTAPNKSCFLILDPIKYTGPKSVTISSEYKDVVCCDNYNYREYTQSLIKYNKRTGSVYMYVTIDTYDDHQTITITFPRGEYVERTKVLHKYFDDSSKDKIISTFYTINKYINGGNISRHFNDINIDTKGSMITNFGYIIYRCVLDRIWYEHHDYQTKIVQYVKQNEQKIYDETLSFYEGTSDIYTFDFEVDGIKK